jgi:hypothetical protein
MAASDPLQLAAYPPKQLFYHEIIFLFGGDMSMNTKSEMGFKIFPYFIRGEGPRNVV